MRSRIALFAAVATLTTTPAAAQQALPPSGVQAAPVPPTEVQPDGRITFRLAAPAAAEVAVLLTGEGLGRYPMIRGADGVWSATTAPLPPEVYHYAFLMGGARLEEDSVVVPGSPPRPYELQPAPHGTVTNHLYVSQVQNRTRALNVYLPPQYYTKPGRRFPVVYLFAGMGENDWTRSGRANLVLDTLIAGGKAVPMIVVMPNNTTGPRPVPALENAAIMEREIVTEIMPMIDRTYRTQSDRAHRAIAGLSFGGGTAFTVGMRHLDSFGYVAEFGTGVFGGGERTAYAPGYADFDPEKITPGLYARLAAPATRPKLFFMSVGDADPRAPFQRKAYDAFREHGAAPVFRSYPGGHEWKVFRNSFIDLAPLLFR